MITLFNALSFVGYALMLYVLVCLLVEASKFFARRLALAVVLTYNVKRRHGIMRAASHVRRG